jgi:hypothetical protein
VQWSAKCLAGETEVLRETCPSAAWSTTNPKWFEPCSNSGSRSGNPETNRLCYGTACMQQLLCNFDFKFEEIKKPRSVAKYRIKRFMNGY